MVSVQYRATGSSAKDIADSFEAGIRDGDLAPGALLPSVRALAADLEVAAGTAAAAYRRLRERGLVEAQGRHGTTVAQRPPVVARSSNAPVAAGVVDLASGQPDPRLLPKVRTSLVRGPAAAPTVLVLPELHELATARLAADRIPTNALTVTSGGLDALHRTLVAQLRPGDTVAVEDPGWPNALDLLAALGMRTRPLPLDSSGPLPDGLRTALQAGARAAIITSRAQNPTGAVLTPARGQELRAVLASYPETLVIEDDHAAELASVPLTSLAGVTSSWAFVRSLSKPYGPDLRLAILAGDDITVARVAGQLQIGAGWVSTLLQRMVIDLWTDPEVTATVQRAGQEYDARRRLLLDHLSQHGIGATADTGLNVWVPVHDETATVTAMLQSGWAIAPGSRFRQSSPPAVRLTVSALTSVTIPRVAADLASAIERAPSRRYAR